MIRIDMIGWTDLDNDESYIGYPLPDPVEEDEEEDDDPAWD
jgi:hypothetical protein